MVALDEVERVDREKGLKGLWYVERYPEILRGVCRIVAALPPTQVSVERLFSALRLILSHLRGNMKADVVEAILFLRTNKCFD